MKLTSHFTLEELCYSSTAIAHGIDNEPLDYHVRNLAALCENVLEPLRMDMGCNPLFISSGYRCPQLNALVGGARNSQHTRGEAADIACQNYEYAKKMLETLMSGIDFDQAFIEKSGNVYWLHVSNKRDMTKNRRSVLRMQIKN